MVEKNILEDYDYISYGQKKSKENLGTNYRMPPGLIVHLGCWGAPFKMEHAYFYVDIMITYF